MLRTASQFVSMASPIMDSAIAHADESASFESYPNPGREFHPTNPESSPSASSSTSIALEAGPTAYSIEDRTSYPHGMALSRSRLRSPPETDDSDYYQARSVRLGPPRTITYKLWKSRELKIERMESFAPASLEPDVLYVAKVFDAKDISERQNPKAEYQDSTPLKFDHITRKEATLLTNHSNSLTEDFRASWHGPIITISHMARAWFPYRNERVDGPQRPSRHEITASTEDFDALSFERVEPSRLTIRSPFLYRRLRSIAGYYPSFFDAGEGNLTDLSLTHWSDTRGATQFSEPWYFLLHRYHEMEASVTGGDLDNVQTKMPDDAAESISYLETAHTRRLLRFLKPYYDGSVVPLNSQLDQDPAQIPFHMLWYIFEPGTDVYVPSGSSFQAMVVARVKSNVEDEDYLNFGSSRDRSNSEVELKHWTLDLWYLDVSGSKVGRVMTQVRLNAYSGTKSITSLTVCPTSIWDKYDEGSRRRGIMDRSKLLVQTLEKGHLLANYNGPIKGTTRHYSGTVVLDPERGASTSRISRPLLGRVKDFCDSKQYRDYGEINDQMDSTTETADSKDDDEEVEIEQASTTGQIGPVNKWRSTIKTGPSLRIFQEESKQKQAPKEKYTRHSLSDHQLLLLNNTACAFALKTKAWLTIYTDYASEVTQSDDSIKHLVLDEHELKTIKALSTRQYSHREAWAADFIEGKGTGQIILLHGPPGVGKTYTVEAFAEYLCRPLLSLTVADIGTVETRVEQELLKWFVLAESWDAILLVDEADIFLERRQNRDLARNGLVSAFLRRMEYFQGLLFLTTNRVGQIDDAFISRVHVAIGYGSLSPESRIKIWQGFFRKLAKERAGRIQITPKAKQWILDKAASGEAQLNGRDIRNALQTAITLAEAEYNEDEDFDPEKTTVVVDQSHFGRVLDITNKFHSYVQSIRREDERKRAAARMDRNDYWINKELERGSSL